MRKLLNVLLVGTMVIGSLAGCGNTGSGSAEVDSGIEKEVPPVDDEMAALYANIPDEIPDLSGYTISIMTPTHFSGAVHDDILPIYAMVEDLTGVTIKWETVSAEYNAALETRLLSDTPPDIFYTGQYHDGPGLAVIDGYIKDGMLYEISQAYDVAPNMKEFYEEGNPDYTEAFTYLDGGMYIMPTSRYSSREDYLGHRAIEETIFYRSDIAKELGFTEIPTTISDWYELLTAVKAAYPDMIPYNCAEPFAYGVDDLGTFGSAWGIQSNLCVFNKLIVADDGSVQLQAINDEMKAFVTEMNKWYEEGLLGFTADGDDRFALPSTGTIFAEAGIAVTPGTPSWETLRDIDEDALFLAAPYPSTDGYETVFMARNMYEGIACIADNGEDQARAAIQLVDFMWFSDFGKYSNLLGVMSPDTWHFDENGNLVVGKEHAMALFNGTYDVSMDGGNIWYMMPGANYGVKDQNDDLKVWYEEYLSQLEGEAKEIQDSRTAATSINYEHWTKTAFPDGFKEDADKDTYSQLMPPLSDYVVQTISGMITGDIDIAEWDSFVNTCYNDFQLQKIIDIQEKYVK